MSNQRVFGSKLDYEQWRFLTGGNVRGYRKYERRYKININLFYKKNNVQPIVSRKNLQIA